MIGEVLWGEYSELSPVDSLDPLPLLLPVELVTEPVRELFDISAQCVFGKGGGAEGGGGLYALGWLALRERVVGLPGRRESGEAERSLSLS